MSTLMIKAAAERATRQAHWESNERTARRVVYLVFILAGLLIYRDISVLIG